ncbi:hypothetical protein [Clostridium scatologenes]|nr:hypothetical protein [Clostridium scatologenes]
MFPATPFTVNAPACPSKAIDNLAELPATVTAVGLTVAAPLTDIA